MSEAIFIEGVSKEMKPLVAFNNAMDKHYDKVLRKLEKAVKRTRDNPVAAKQVREAQVIYMREAYRFACHYDKIYAQFAPFFQRCD